MRGDIAAERRSNALRWQDEDAAANYRFRPTYPPETFDILLSLMGSERRVVLDVGCGTGNLARPFAACLERVDAVDVSSDMVAAGKRLAGGDAANLRWQVARAEDAVLDGPYGLIVGGESFHWIDASVALPRFADALTADGVLAVVYLNESSPQPWDEDVLAVIVLHSTGYWPTDMIGDWERAGLFRRVGERTTAPVAFEQPVEQYIASFHARASLMRAHIDADAFGAEMRAVMAQHCPGGVIAWPITATVTWGRPL